ncbi:MAG: winged helix-turn-helix transcriptional regulator [Firmicutes bacterium]|nr:winged helix-turn-helix transcriptional regulator [Bacillota bacterium]
MILDLIEKNKNITQREMSITIGVAVSMINSYVDQYEQKGFIKRKYISTKTVEYFVTKTGSERKKVLNISYLSASQKLYNSAKENIESFLIQIENTGFKNILLYGAGEVCEILLNAMKSSKVVNIKALAIVDDNIDKIGNKIGSTNIISRESISNFQHDGILISSYTNNESIYYRLMQVGYSKDKIIQFFSL